MFIGLCKFLRLFSFVLHLTILSSNFSGNIPNSDVSKGEIIVPYLQPFPPRGTGFHRHIFVLYKQDKKIDFNEYKVNEVYVK